MTGAEALHARDEADALRHDDDDDDDDEDDDEDEQESVL